MRTRFNRTTGIDTTGHGTVVEPRWAAVTACAAGKFLRITCLLPERFPRETGRTELADGPQGVASRRQGTGR